MTPQSADAARNSHHKDTQDNTTTQPTQTTNTSTTTKNQHNNHKNQTKNQEQSTNRAGIRMPPAVGPRETAKSRGPRVGASGSVCGPRVGVRHAA